MSYKSIEKYFYFLFLNRNIRKLCKYISLLKMFGFKMEYAYNKPWETSNKLSFVAYGFLYYL